MADPKVGPADPATVHRLLQERQKSDAKGDRTYQRPAPSQPSQPQGVPITGSDRLGAVDSVVDHAQRSGNPEPSKYSYKP
jgi:hypothetical protein